MDKKFNFFVHSKKDAIFLIEIASQEHLKLINLNMFANNSCYCVSYDNRTESFLTNFPPFMFYSKDLKTTFLDIIEHVYPDNIL